MSVAFVVLVLLALVLRVVALPDKPFHHDEAQDAYFSWRFLTTGEYEYDPLLHGPVRFFLTALAYLVAGDSDTTARIVPALAGTAMVGLPWFLRRRLGSAGALAAAALLCVDPVYLYFSRFAREDIYVAALTLGLIVVVFRFLDRPARWQPALILALLAASFATKESTFITVFVAGTFFLAALAAQVRRERRDGRRWVSAPLVATVRSVGARAWAWAAAAFAGVFTILFTTFLTHPGGLPDGLVRGLSYWLGQHDVGRGGQPWDYYGVLLVAYEWLALGLGVVGAVAILRRPTLLGAFLIWDFGLSLAVYSWAGEKFPWLLLHPLLPLLLLAGVGVQALWDARGRRTARAGLVLAAAATTATILASVGVAFERPADPRELLVSTQTSPEVPAAVERLETLDRSARRERGRPLTIEVDSADGGNWPWGWYLRDMRAGFVDMGSDGYRPRADALIVSDANRPGLARRLRGYEGTPLRLRAWWVPDYGQASPSDWARWLVERRPWRPTGSLHEWLYVRRAVLAPATGTR